MTFYAFVVLQSLLQSLTSNVSRLKALRLTVFKSIFYICNSPCHIHNFTYIKFTISVLSTRFVSIFCNVPFFFSLIISMVFVSITSLAHKRTYTHLVVVRCHSQAIVVISFDIRPLLLLLLLLLLDGFSSRGTRSNGW